MDDFEPEPVSAAEEDRGGGGSAAHALLLVEPNRLEWGELDVPQLDAGDVLVRSEAVGICGTDHELLDGRLRRGCFPLVLGHEWAGVVVASAEPEVRVGTRVVGENVLAQYDDGSSIEVGFERPGGFARYFRTSGRLMRGVSDLAPWHAALAEPTAVCVRIVERSGAAPGESVLVVGTGTLAVICIALLHARGVREIGVVGNHPARLALAERAGATTRVQPGPLAEARWDAVIEVSGSAAPLTTALAAARRGGRVVLASAYGEEASMHGLDLIVVKELELVGSVASADAWDGAVAALRAGIVTPELVNARRFSMRDWRQAFAHKAHDPACLKVVLVHDDEPGTAGVNLRRLGRTGMEVSEIGYGAWGIGGAGWIGAQDAESVRALHRAIDLGVNFIDTALEYGWGHSEQLVGQVVRERAERVHVATKVPPKNLVWPARPGVHADEAFPGDHVRACVDRSLTNLGLDVVDLLQLHVWSDEWVGQGDWLETVEALKATGKIRAFGVSINDYQPSNALAAIETGAVDTVQVVYNVFEQAPEDELLGRCAELDVGVIARVPFDEGGLTGAVRPGVEFPPGDFRAEYFAGDRARQVAERAQAIVDALGRPLTDLPEVALRFVLSRPEVSAVIPGMRSVRNVDRNVPVGDGRGLPADDVRRLRAHRWDRAGN